jgi:carbonic anhydrase
MNNTMSVAPRESAAPLDITPEAALQRLKMGNIRFISNLHANHDLLSMVNATQDNQWPFAAILSCMDSRTSAELIFDQGLGDIFSIRIAGNIIMPSILGSLEYAVAVAGSKLILVLGHTGCGAIKGACDNIRLGNLNTVIDAIRPAVDATNDVEGVRNSTNPEFVTAVAKLHVTNSMQRILQDSPIIKDLVDAGTVGLEGGLYDLATGKVRFF